MPAEVEQGIDMVPADAFAAVTSRSDSISYYATGQFPGSTAQNEVTGELRQTRPCLWAPVPTLAQRKLVLTYLHQQIEGASEMQVKDNEKADPGARSAVLYSREEDKEEEEEEGFQRADGAFLSQFSPPKARKLFKERWFGLPSDQLF
ncbi:hypothetical protein H920_07432 [Fukomys damarensis]|uniref:Uncharacterized protein n=1 Tax=Fukomys damarensis TaxID=885580 RepID=A0A091DKY9_FUKDA|nr:hypothetical protein H920_07432 [Fukomys damarensis]